jgi:hypothetical protein
MLKHTTVTDDNGYTVVLFDYDVRAQQLQVNGRLVESITLQATVDGGELYCGDLAVNWRAEDDSDYKHNTQLLMRDANDTNNNTATMGEFYWEHAFDDTLHALLIEAGFSADAVMDVYGSEWGMQDVGRASYDANECCEEMLRAHGIEYVDPFAV